MDRRGCQAPARGDLMVHSIGVLQSKSLKLVGLVDGIVVILSGVMLGLTQPACGADEWRAAAQEAEASGGQRGWQLAV